MPVWVLTAAAVMWVGLSASEDRRVSSLVAVLAASLLASFTLQIVAYRSGGLVKRLTLTVTGSTVITLSASAVFAVMAVVD